MVSIHIHEEELTEKLDKGKLIRRGDMIIYKDEGDYYFRTDDDAEYEFHLIEFRAPGSNNLILLDEEGAENPPMRHISDVPYDVLGNMPLGSWRTMLENDIKWFSSQDIARLIILAPEAVGKWIVQVCMNKSWNINAMYTGRIKRSSIDLQRLFFQSAVNIKHYDLFHFRELIPREIYTRDAATKIFMGNEDLLMGILEIDDMDLLPDQFYFSLDPFWLDIIADTVGVPRLPSRFYLELLEGNVGWQTGVLTWMKKNGISFTEKPYTLGDVIELDDTTAIEFLMEEGAEFKLPSHFEVNQVFHNGIYSSYIASVLLKQGLVEFPIDMMLDVEDDSVKRRFFDFVLTAGLYEANDLIYEYGEIPPLIDVLENLSFFNMKMATRKRVKKPGF